MTLAPYQDFTHYLSSTINRKVPFIQNLKLKHSMDRNDEAIDNDNVTKIVHIPLLCLNDVQ